MPARFAIVPRFATTASGAPKITLAAIRAALHAENGDSIVKVAIFNGDSAVLVFDVQITGTANQYVLRLAAVDATGDTVYRALDTLTVVPGDNSAPPITMTYASADTLVRLIQIVPRDTVLSTADTLKYRVTAWDANDNQVNTTVHVAWTSRDTTVAAFPAVRGTILAKDLQDTVWVVASTFSGAADSTRLFVQAAVASVTLNLDTASVLKRDSIKLSAIPKDGAGSPLTRAVTWRAVTSNVTVDTAGWVKGISIGNNVMVIATSGAKADTARLNVLPRPVASVVGAPDSITLAFGGTTTVSASIIDDQGQPNADFNIAWVSQNAAVATISPAGLVTGIAAGTTGVIASAGGKADTIKVKVQAAVPGVDSTTISPRLDSLYSLSDTVRLVARTWKGGVQVAGSYSWVSRNTAFTTVSGLGTITAIANGGTYVVVTDTSGTKDSARVVVQQRVAQINVTPSSVARYLGTTQQFSAVAVDGKNNPMGSASFTWSSTNTAIATVGTSTGLASMVGIGVDTIIASVGFVSGRAALNVRPVVQQIIVSPDSVKLTSLGLTQGYTAVAKDTIGATMTGVTFAWSSTNPAVAPLSGTTATTTVATAALNGNTVVRATLQGVIGQVSLSVQQQLASILVTPGSASVGVLGKIAMSARGKDAGGSFIPGGAFSWSSNNTSAATVDAAGVVTGVAIGAGNAGITATSGAITSNTATIVVSASVPQAITFAKDTFTLGRQATLSVPIYLATPQGTAVTVKLRRRYADTVVFFAPAGAADSIKYVQIPANQTSTNVTISSRNAGFTYVYASDSANVIANNDTAAVAILSTAKFTTTGYSLNANDSYPTQVLLTDPAPQGGSYVAMTYGTPGKAQVSPDPVYIPQGQLAGDVVIQGLAAGSTTITPSSPGVAGTASTTTVYAAQLFNQLTTYRLGAGQYQPSLTYISVNTYLYGGALTIAMTSSDSTIAKTDNPVVIANGQYYQYFSAYGFQPGTVKILSTAPGWAPDSGTIIVTSPRLRNVSGSPVLQTTSPVTNMSVYTTDSLLTAHYRINPLVVRAASSDPSIVKVLDTLITIAAGQLQATTRIQAIAGGTAYIKYTAGGHLPDSALVTVQPPKLLFSFAQVNVGKGLEGVSVGYVYVPNNVTQALTINIRHTQPTIANTANPIILPTGTYYSYFNVRGLTQGLDSIIATAAGYDSAIAVIKVNTPRLRGSGGGTYQQYSPDVNFGVVLQDSLGSGEYAYSAGVVVSMSSTDTNVIAIDSSQVTVLIGQISVTTPRARIKNPGTARIRLTAPGFTPDTTTIVYTIQPAKISFSWTTTNVGLRMQTGGFAGYLSVPNNVTQPLKVAIAQVTPGIVSIPDTITIPAGTYYQYFGWSGLALGTTSLIATAQGYLPDTASIHVSSTKLVQGGLPSTATTTQLPYTTYVYARDSVGNGWQVITGDTVVVRVTSSDPTVIAADSPFVHIFGGLSNSTPIVTRFLKAGTARLRFQDTLGVYKPDSTNLVTVTGPSLTFSTSGTLTVGMRQHLGLGSVYVTTSNNVTGQPLRVYLSSSDTNVARVPAFVDIPVGTYYVYFDIFGQSQTGTIQIRSDSAAGNSPAAPFNVQVGRPQLVVSTPATAVTTSLPQYFYVYSRDQAGAGRYPSENVVVNLTSSAPGVAFIDSTTVTIPVDQQVSTAAQVHYLAAGTTQLTASDPRSGAAYQYTSSSQNVAVSIPQLASSFATLSLAVNQYSDQYVQLPNYVVGSPTRIYLNQTNASVADVPASIQIPVNQYYTYYRVTGSAAGSDTIYYSDSAFVHRPDTSVVSVGVGLLQFSPPASIKVGDSVFVTLYTMTPQNGYNNVLLAETFNVSTTGGIQFHVGNANVTSVTVPAQNYYVQFYIKGIAAGSAPFSITSAANGRYTTYSNIITVIP